MFSPSSFPHGPKVEVKKALMLIDFQEDFTSSTGKLSIPNNNSFLTKLPSLITKFRERGPVIWVQTIFRQPCSSISPQTGGYSILMRKFVDNLKQQDGDDESDDYDLQSYEASRPRRFLPVVSDDDEAFLSSRVVPTKRCCLPNTKGSEISAELLQSFDKHRDWVFHKSQYSALADLSSVIQLRARMINDLYICGSSSNIGVHATVLDAVQQGFNVTLIDDCLGYRDEVCHVEAIRRMADDLGAEGTDYQELMDDLYGMLGEVIPTGRFSRKFQLSMQQGAGRGQISHAQKVSQWMQTIESEGETDTQPSRVENAISEPSIAATSNVVGTAAKSPQHDSPGQAEIHRGSPKYSPSRKRSTSDREELGETSPPLSRTSQEYSINRAGSETSAKDKSVAKKSKVESSNTKTKSEATPSSSRSPKISSPKNLGQSMSTGHLETSQQKVIDPPRGERTMSEPNVLPNVESPDSNPKVKRQKHKNDVVFFGPEDSIADGDTKVIYDVLPRETADGFFTSLKNEVVWQKMYHRTGEVPRLVAVQGDVGTDGSIPIYRHPADESPPLLPFDKNVDYLRKQCEKLVGHQLNHVLIQYYRNSEDNISEHSDKTIDIVRGSTIVNLSLGAMRTMTLRTKKVTQAQDSSTSTDPQPATTSMDSNQIRTAQRIRLPHNSLFVLGERTNANWLHAIRADKRPICEKTEDELAFDGQRISLTFRLIGTFIDLERQLIWGQGATSKSRAYAQRILKGRDAETAGEEMIIGFGKENHCIEAEFNRQEVYGKGFDVVNFEVKSPTDSVER